MTKQKTKIVIAVMLGLFVSFGVVLAVFHGDVAQSRDELRQELERRIQQQTDELKARQETLRQQTLERKEEAFSAEDLKERAREHQERFEAEREKLREQMQQRREEFEARAEEMREAAREELERRKQEFREKLEQIREERHRQLAEKLSEQMNRVNQHMSDAALNYLDALELVLGKIEARTDIVQDATGADLAQVRQEIAAGRAQIEVARTTVLAQKSKEYVLNIESQETLGQDIRGAMQEVRNDHRRLREEVLHPLRNLVRDVMLALRTAVATEGQKGQRALEEDFAEENEQ